MTDVEPTSKQDWDVLVLPGLALIALGLILWLPAQTRPDLPPAHLDLFVTLGAGAPRVTLWFLAAIGFGRPLAAWLAPRSDDRLFIQCVLGVMSMLAFDALLARLGVLDEIDGLIAWGVLVLGSGLSLDQFRRFIAHRGGNRRIDLTERSVLALPAVVVLIIAACSAPGLLWASEFGGYDALSYHLQLPKEWIVLGQARGLTHNVYSFLPSYVECASMHLMLLRDDPIHAACDAQLLHAGMTILTAVVAGRLASRLAGTWAGAITTVLILGTPWTIVVGSLAYNEMAVALALAGGLLVIRDESLYASPARRGAVIGFLAAGACGAKLTAVGFVALPLAALMMVTAGSMRRASISAAVAAISGLVVLLPYLISNWALAGNPVFPFATALFGEAHWTTEQLAAWHRGHFSSLSVSARFEELLNQWVRYGIGPNPSESEPWKPHWSVLPILGIGCAVVSVARRVHRGTCVQLLFIIAFQIAFWMFFSHLKSRFLIPVIIPLSIMIAVTICGIHRGDETWSRGRTISLMIVLGCVIYALQPAALFLSEGRVPGVDRNAPARLIGAFDDLTGDSLASMARYRNASRDERRRLLEPFSIDIWLNLWVAPDERVLSVGYAVPFYCRSPSLHYQTTWDRGPFSHVMREFDDESQWLRALANDGYDFLLIDYNMIERWNRAGWGDPLLSLERIQAATEGAKIVTHWSSGQVLYDLRGF